MRIRWSLAALPAAALAALLPAAGAAPPPEPTVTLARGASLAETLAALHRATGGAVVSEVPTVERNLDRELKAAPLPKAVEEVSRSFQLYWQRRGDVLVFLRRYRDPREKPDLEVEELAACLADVDRLVSPFFTGSPLLWATGLTRDQGEFVSALSTEQVRLMRTGGLPFTSLAPEQRKRWLGINNTRGYASDVGEARALARMFDQWKRGALEYLTNMTTFSSGEKRLKTSLKFTYPDPHFSNKTRGGIGWQQVYEPSVGGNEPPQTPMEGIGAEVPEGTDPQISQI